MAVTRSSYGGVSARKTYILKVTVDDVYATDQLGDCHGSARRLACAGVISTGGAQFAASCIHALCQCQRSLSPRNGPHVLYVAWPGDDSYTSVYTYIYSLKIEWNVRNGNDALPNYAAAAAAAAGHFSLGSY